ncbi:alpha/beta hydrolase [Gordonia sp. zg691]|uniref:alpha/beta hydrolase n=1 Tax=Gordonia jinghuaiqii TaxID=2758710 RepID=UPI00166251B7|nr:alpha/beta hydrolase [Gordonia jinghuaiqii]MBD0860366.1 alpha/beta hydrolase [Gordonia jinghuaiqii]
MGEQKLIFLHGAGGFADDRPLAHGLGAALGVPVDMPQFSDDDMSLEAWASPIRARLATMSDDDLLVAHSFGASVLLHVLAEGGREMPRRAVLLAMPNWGPQGWGMAEYAFAAPEPRVALSLHHCLDDPEVPVAHLDLNAALLPSARLHRHRTGGHQFGGLAEIIAADLRAGLPRV